MAETLVSQVVKDWKWFHEAQSRLSIRKNVEMKKAVFLFFFEVPPFTS